MKRLWLFLLCFPLLLSAQQPAKAPGGRKTALTLGLKAGMNRATIKYESRAEYHAILGYNAGIAARLHAGPKFLLQPEFLYSVKGTKFKGAGIAEGISRRLHYLTLPILFGYTPLKRMTILAGPELGFLQKAGTEDGWFADTYYEDFDFGIIAGLSYGLSDRLAVELRYGHGFERLHYVLFTDQYGNIIDEGYSGANRVVSLNMHFHLIGK